MPNQQTEDEPEFTARDIAISRVIIFICAIVLFVGAILALLHTHPRYAEAAFFVLTGSGCLWLTFWFLRGRGRPGGGSQIDMPKKKTQTFNSFADFLSKLGLLHDCTVTKLEWNPSAKTMKFEIEDLHSNFKGLPEYRGPTRGQIAFEGVHRVDIAMSGFEGPMRIYEFEISKANVATVAFSPAGKIVVAWDRVMHPDTV